MVEVKSERKLTKLAVELDADLRAIRRSLRKPLAAAIARGELTAPQRSIMHFLVRSDGLSLKELSHRAELAHSTVSGIVDRLEIRGLVVRQPDSKDDRLTRIVVADQVRIFMREKLPELTVQPLLEALHRSSLVQRTKIVEGVRMLRRALAGTGAENSRLGRD